MHSCMIARDSNCEMLRCVVAAWESALDLMLQKVELSAVPRHPGLVEVFEAEGLGLTTDGVYRLTFGSNLKQQALLRAPGSEIVRTVVIEALRRVGIDAASVSPVIPSRLGGSAASTGEYDDGWTERTGAGSMAEVLDQPHRRP